MQKLARYLLLMGGVSHLGVYHIAAAVNDVTITFRAGNKNFLIERREPTYVRKLVKSYPGELIVKVTGKATELLYLYDAASRGHATAPRMVPMGTLLQQYGTIIQINKTQDPRRQYQNKIDLIRAGR
jgi:hypothetical protein